MLANSRQNFKYLCKKVLDASQILTVSHECALYIVQYSEITVNTLWQHPMEL